MGATPEISAAPPAVNGAARSETVLVEAVDGCRRRLTLRALLARLLLIAALGALVPLLVVIADHRWAGGLPALVRQGVLMLWAAGLFAALLAAVATTLLRRVNPLFAARYLERMRGIPHNSVVNALVLRRGGQAVYAEQAAVRQAALDVIRHGQFVGRQPRQSRLPEIMLLATVTAWLLYLGGSPKPIGPSLARFFGADVAAATATWLELVRPGAEDVTHAGERTDIEIAVHGQEVSDVRLEILDPDGGLIRAYTSSEPLGGEADRRRFVLAPFEVSGDIYYRCLAGDARLEGVIPVQPQPDVVSLAIVLEPPAYTGWPRKRVTVPDLDVLAGTEATFTAVANVAVTDPVFVLEGQRETRTRMSVAAGTSEVLTVTVRLTQSGRYRIEFSDRWGYPHHNPPEYRVDVRPDVPPSVQIVVPALGQAPDDIVDVTEFRELVALAEDDVGVTELAFALERGGAISRSEVVGIGAPGRPHVRGGVNAGELPLEPGRPARAWFEAPDARVLPDGRSAPQMGRSRVLTLMRPVSAPVAEEAQDADDTPQTQPGGQTERRPGIGDSQPVELGDQEEVAPPLSDEREATGGNAGAEEASPDQEFERELDRFVREHGEEAREVALRGRRPDDAASTTDRDEPREKQGEQCERGAQGQPKPDASSSEKGKDLSRTGPSQRGNSAGAGECSGKPGERSANPDGSRGKCSGSGAEAPGADGSQPGRQGRGIEAGRGGHAQDEPADKRGEGNGEDSAQTPGETGEPGGEGGAGTGGGGGAARDGETGDQRAAESDSAEPSAESPPTGTSTSPESTGLVETLDLLGMLERGDEVTEEMLTEAGWPAGKATAFVRALRRLHVAARRSGDVNTLRRVLFDTRVGDQDRQTGRGLSAAVGRGADPAEARRDGLRRIAPPGEQSVPEELEPLLEAYYRSLAAQRSREEP